MATTENRREKKWDRKKMLWNLRRNLPQPAPVAVVAEPAVTVAASLAS